MSGKCDILILTATFGTGHMSVSNAILDYIKINAGNLNVRIADIFQIIKPETYKGVYKGYEFLIKTNSKLYNYFYYRKNFNNSLQMDDVMCNLYLSKFADYIMDVDPAIIISTFPLCSRFVSKYKEEYKSYTPLITCITDVVDSKEWIYSETNRYYVATLDVKNGLVRKGIDESIIKVTGIPVRKEFVECRRDRSMLEEYGIKEDDFVIMLMGGGMGLLPGEIKYYKWLNDLEGIKVLVLTGNNRELYKKLCKQKDLNNIKVLKYMDNVFEIMVNSDLLVTKAGGVTVFEAIASKVPTIVYRPILGQEVENGKFITEQGIGSIAWDLTELKEKINQVIEDKEYRDELSGNINKLSISIDMDGLLADILYLYKNQTVYSGFVKEEYNFKC